ncbi:unnamed protein product [Cylicostephanus goldi]|uniref:ABC transporter domain-containing protein n=1 Tax=Cylicostephanus goldi TaxID=71465 RepID=A0A3P7LUR8_CYLGO|nr:unnamed protein product [Cylicostephanus goldi]
MARIGGLDGQIEESGKNLSFGERQIISICRVLLAQCKVSSRSRDAIIFIPLLHSQVVLIDEATSHLDANVHQRMMSLISSYLPRATVICITHVMHGLSDFDTVIEMANGKIISRGPPEQASISHEIQP